MRLRMPGSLAPLMLALGAASGFSTAAMLRPAALQPRQLALSQPAAVSCRRASVEPTMFLGAPAIFIPAIFLAVAGAAVTRAFTAIGSFGSAPLSAREGHHVQVMGGTSSEGAWARGMLGAVKPTARKQPQAKSLPAAAFANAPMSMSLGGNMIVSAAEPSRMGMGPAARARSSAQAPMSLRELGVVDTPTAAPAAVPPTAAVTDETDARDVQPPPNPSMSVRLSFGGQTKNVAAGSAGELYAAARRLHALPKDAQVRLVAKGMVVPASGTLPDAGVGVGENVLLMVAATSPI